MSFSEMDLIFELVVSFRWLPLYCVEVPSMVSNNVSSQSNTSNMYVQSQDAVSRPPNPSDDVG